MLMGEGGLLVQVCDLILHLFRFVVDSDFHVPICQRRAGCEEAVLEDFVKVRCGEDFWSFVLEAEQMLENSACKASTIYDLINGR